MKIHMKIWALRAHIAWLTTIVRPVARMVDAIDLFMEAKVFQPWETFSKRRPTGTRR